MASYIKIIFALFSITMLTACNTVKGFGEDLQNLGDSIEESAN